MNPWLWQSPRSPSQVVLRRHRAPACGPHRQWRCPMLGETAFLCGWRTSASVKVAYLQSAEWRSGNGGTTRSNLRVALPIQVRVLEQNLFSPDDPDGPLFGTASLVGDDGLIYVYSCRTGGELDESSGEDCYVARVAPEGVSEADAYAVWNGERFTPDRTEAAPMVLPAGNTDKPIAPGQLSVAWHADSATYVMAYSPWPGWSDSIHFRVADRPWGPWSEPTSLPLPGCADFVGGQTFACYTANRQPFMDAPRGAGDWLLRQPPGPEFWTGQVVRSRRGTSRVTTTGRRRWLIAPSFEPVSVSLKCTEAIDSTGEGR